MIKRKINVGEYRGIPILKQFNRSAEVTVLRGITGHPLSILTISL